MAHTSLFDLLWINVDFDSTVCPLKTKQKKLVDICAEKLISDVLLVKKYCHNLPKSINLLIFSTAVAKKRTLSIEQLMRFYPHKTLELPLPDFLKVLHTIPHIKDSRIDRELVDFSRILMTVLCVFFDLIKKVNSNSQLCTLDLGLFPLRNAALVKIYEFLFKERAKVPSFTKIYTLKCTVAVENSTDLRVLKACVEKSSSLGFYLNITGIYFYNDIFIDVEALKLFDYLKKHNLQLIAFNFASLTSSFEFLFKELKFFKFVKYLNLSYVVNLFSSDSEVRKLAIYLTELTNLQRLVLKGINLNGMISTLLLENCKKYRCGISAPDCCFIHSGSLCYLDISSCRLSDSDLEFLRELSIANSLKYLDISENSLHERRTFDILVYLKCSLQALNVSACFKHLIDYDDAVMPFSAFTQLKYLNIKNLKISESSQHLLEHELKKMPNLEIIESSIIPVTVY